MKFFKKSEYGIKFHFGGKDVASFLLQRLDHDHGEVLTIIVNGTIYTVEYDKDGDLVMIYSPRELKDKVRVLVVYLSKVYTRKGGESSKEERFLGWC